MQGVSERGKDQRAIARQLIRQNAANQRLRLQPLYSTDGLREANRQLSQSLTNDAAARQTDLSGSLGNLGNLGTMDYGFLRKRRRRSGGTAGESAPELMIGGQFYEEPLQ